MAGTEDVRQLRQNVDEPTDETWDDDELGALIDGLGLARASSEIWRRKAAAYAKLVDVSEAGSSHAFSDLHKNALAMAKMYDSAHSGGRARVSVIERPYGE